METFTNDKVASSPDLEDMLKQAKRLASVMRTHSQETVEEVEDVDLDNEQTGQQGNYHDTHQCEAMLQRADRLAQQIMNRNDAHVKETKEGDVYDHDRHTKDPTGMHTSTATLILRGPETDLGHDDLLLQRAGKLAAQMQTSNDRVQCWRTNDDSVNQVHQPDKSKSKSMTLTTDSDHCLQSLDHERVHTDLFTPHGIVATVSMDDQDEDVETMLLKADLLSKTIRSAASGQLNTPELIRASDEILKRAKCTEKPTVTETTPQLLARAHKIFSHPDSRTILGDGSVEIVGESTDTDLVRNATQLPALLDRPPRPPLPPMRTLGCSQPNVTPSPKAVPLNAHATEGLLEHVIATLQRVPTTKTPDSPVMPKSLALKTMDSDDYSSVGSGSARSIPRSHHGTDRSNDNPDQVHHSSNSFTMEETSTKSVEVAEDMAKMMARELEETLSSTQASLRVENMAPPLLRPQDFTTPITARQLNTHLSPSNESQGQILQRVWDDCDAISSSSRTKERNDEAFLKIVADSTIEWETMAPVQKNDDDYVPIQDFRNGYCRSIGVGQMPENKEGQIGSRKRSPRRWKRSKIVFAFLFFVSLISFLAIKFFYNNIGTSGSDVSTSSTATAFADDELVSVELQQHTEDETVQEQQSIRDIPNFWERPNSDLVPRKNRSEAKIKLDDPQLVEHDIGALEMDSVSNDENRFSDFGTFVSTVPKETIKISTTTTTAIGVLQVLFPSRANGIVPNRSIPGHCYLPFLGYTTFPKCRKILQKTILFDAQGLTDGMMQ